MVTEFHSTTSTLHDMESLSRKIMQDILHTLTQSFSSTAPVCELHLILDPLQLATLFQAIFLPLRQQLEVRLELDRNHHHCQRVQHSCIPGIHVPEM